MLERGAWIDPAYGRSAPIVEPYNRFTPEFAEFAYTRQQRNWFERVFNNSYYSLAKKQFVPIRAERVEYHHITPAAWILEQLPGTDPNAIDLRRGLFAIPLTHYEHLYKIHPDMGQAMHDYHVNPNAIRIAVNKHHEAAVMGRIFWDNRWDAVMQTAARTKLIDYMHKHPEDVYPRDKKWKGGNV